MSRTERRQIQKTIRNTKDKNHGWCLYLVELMYNARFCGFLMASVNAHYPRCQSAQVYRQGQNPKGRDRFRCRNCHRVFLLTYTYEARKPGAKANNLISGRACRCGAYSLTR